MKEPTKTNQSKAEAKSKADVTDDEIIDALDGVIKGFKGRADKAQVVGALRTAAELLNRDDSWNPGI